MFCSNKRKTPRGKPVASRLPVALFIVVLALGALLGLTGCNGRKTAVKDFDAPKTNDATASDVKKGIKPIPDPEVAVIETADFGNIVVELYPNIAPQMVGRFKKLIAEGFYNGTSFHRVNSASGLIQGGDPLSKDNDPANDGTGDSNEPNLPAEFSDIPFEEGTVGAARRGESPAVGGRAALTEEQARGTANCQFFITLSRNAEFDEEYTVFGRVIQGINTADVIMRAPVEEGTEQSQEKIVIKRISLQPRSRFSP
jgi:peptidyl-prolyl cis-trans isomerase B (cyclophilin B)